MSNPGSASLSLDRSIRAMFMVGRNSLISPSSPQYAYDMMHVSVECSELENATRTFIPSNKLVEYCRQDAIGSIGRVPYGLMTGSVQPVSA